VGWRLRTDQALTKLAGLVVWKGEKQVKPADNNNSGKTAYFSLVINVVFSGGQQKKGVL
jgi:hypothetical protein